MTLKLCLRNSFLLSLLSLLLLLLTGCKPKVPSDYIQPGKMRRILYDYTIACELAKRQSSDSLLMLSYKANIMKKHKVTMEEFDSSMVYYTRHTRRLSDIYEKLSTQLSEEALAQGASLSDVNKFGHISETDTCSVWQAEREFMLSPYITANTRNFFIQADSSFQKGDKLIFDFDTKFINNEETSSVLAVMSMRLANDSVVTTSRTITSATHSSITMGDNKMLGIKDVTCCFILNPLKEKQKMQQLFVSNIQLIRKCKTDNDEHTLSR